MLDHVTYRAAETQARATTTWRVLQVHRLDAFEAVGFPTRINSVAELGMFLDTMQEGRAQAYREALAPLSDEEAAILQTSVEMLSRFASTWFPIARRPQPNGPWGMLSVYRRLTQHAPDFTRILDIGPGTGYLAFVLAQHKPLTRYVSIEVCEPFYLLQHMVNAFTFGDKAEDLALGERPNAISTHVPWWQIGRVAEEKFDVVSANGCLLEMTPKALDQYLKLAATVLEPGGKFVAQCFGRWQNGNASTLAREFAKHGFKCVLMEPEGKFPVFTGIWERAAAGETVRAPALI